MRSRLSPTNDELIMISRLTEFCPALLTSSIQLPLFAVPGASLENTPAGMALKFGVPFLGKIPMDPNLMRSCEEGSSFTENFPNSSAALALKDIVESIVSSTQGN